MNVSMGNKIHRDRREQDCSKQQNVGCLDGCFGMAEMSNATGRNCSALFGRNPEKYDFSARSAISAVNDCDRGNR